MSSRDFDQGVLWAVARIVEMFDQPTMAGEILRQSGADVKLADEDDVSFLKEAIESDPMQRS